MHPILFVLSVAGHERPIASYGAMMALAMLVGGLVGVRAAARDGMELGDAIAGAGIVAGSGLAGAYALQLLVVTLETGSFATAFARGGLVFYGAPIVGTLALAAAARPLGASFPRLVDVAIPAVPLAHALGRIGCFLAGCCYGRPCDLPWAVRFVDPMAAAPDAFVARHPVQLYEAFALLVLAGLLILVPPRRVGDGRRAILYVGLYALVRLGTERFRGDDDRGFVLGPVSTSDAIALLSLAVTLALYARRRRREASEAAA